jgi:hypothetical protein
VKQASAAKKPILANSSVSFKQSFKPQTIGTLQLQKKATEMPSTPNNHNALLSASNLLIQHHLFGGGGY